MSVVNLADHRDVRLKKACDTLRKKMASKAPCECLAETEAMAVAAMAHLIELDAERAVAAFNKAADLARGGQDD